MEHRNLQERLEIIHELADVLGVLQRSSENAVARISGSRRQDSRLVRRKTGPRLTKSEMKRGYGNILSSLPGGSNN